jgi:outer membrane murein-binding lipoprotein Lpp
LSDRTLEAVKGLRGLLEDILAPTVGRLDVKVEALSSSYNQLAAEIKENRQAHQALMTFVGEQFSTLNGRISHLEGRSDGLRSELTAALQVEILKLAQRRAFAAYSPEQLPADSGSE